MNDPVTEFLDAMRASGIRPVESIADRLRSGEPIRFRADVDKPGRANGWAQLHLDGRPAGVFRHYKLGVREVWRSGGIAAKRTQAERRELAASIREKSARRAEGARQRQLEARARAQRLWKGAVRPDTKHGYLARKGLLGFGLRQNGDALLVPMVDIGFQLWNVQRIYPDGRKLFLKGGRVDRLFSPFGAFFQIGKPTSGALVIGEGWATMAAIHQATGLGVVAALSTGNLLPVAREMRTQFPAREIILAADDDCHLTTNIGLEAARRAAEEIGGYLALPRPLHAGAVNSADFADLDPADIVLRIECGRLGHE